MTFRHGVAAGLLLILSACHRDEEKDTRDKLRSWRSTLELVRLQREQHNVPAVYAKQVVDQAIDDVSKEFKKPHERATREEGERVLALAAKQR